MFVYIIKCGTNICSDGNCILRIFMIFVFHTNLYLLFLPYLSGSINYPRGRGL